MIHRFRFVIAGVVFVLVNQLVTFAVSAAVPGALLPAGTTRYATAASTGLQQLWSEDGWQNFLGMTKYITVPGGQTADVMVVFCTEADANVETSMFARAYVGGSLASPPQTIMQTEAAVSSQCAIFHKSGVAAGTPAIKVQGMVTGTLANSNDRTMIVLVNLH